MAAAPNRRCVYHGAIDVPTVSTGDAPLRETIEVRLLAIYEKERNKAARVRRFQAHIPADLPDGTPSEWVAKYP